MGEESSSSSALLEEVKNTLEKALQLGDSHELRQLILPIENQLRRQNRRRIASFVFRLIALSTVLFGISFYTPLYYHLRAIGRIGLVQLRPYWDWRDYYQRDCLVANTRRYPQEPRQPSCTLCEDISAVDVVANVSSRFIMDHYLNQELPVIVSDGALNWAVFKNSDFGLEHILKAYEDDDSSWRICNWMSNIRLREENLEDFHQQIERNSQRPWFAQWENCEVESVKTGRRFYPRPYFVSPSVDLSFNNWVLISNQYQTKTFKQVRLRAGIAMFAQIRGSNYLRLIPDYLCEMHCATIEFELKQGEILLMHPKRWDFEYKPAEDSRNLAFIIQGMVD